MHASETHQPVRQEYHGSLDLRALAFVDMGPARTAIPPVGQEYYFYPPCSLFVLMFCLFKIP